MITNLTAKLWSRVIFHRGKSVMASNSELLCAFGVISDVHYADLETGMNYARTYYRHYRRSLDLVKTAVRDWSAGQWRAEFVLQMGDLIDGLNSKLETNHSALDTIMSELTKSGHFVYHVLGNHDLYNFSHAELLTCDQMKFINEGGISTPLPGSSGYYHFAPTKGFRIVVLDNYDISMLGQEEKSNSYQQAKDILMKYNCNDDLNSPHGLKGVMRRFVQFNGGVTADQLHWLDTVLRDSDENKEIVLVVGHIPVYLGASDSLCLVWNYEEILQVLHKHHCVLAYLAGHTHNTAHCQDDSGVHHVVFPGVIKTLLDCPAAHATVLLYPNCVVIKFAEGSGISDIIMNTSRCML